ncbi:uncharacterized protein LOC106662055 [Cimex lectularius]|uniref:Uncharacterized protein n=1 Tax=Cimex lectularius TaxID=79782 RepID=A0A8I6RA07_CIMLE|nr:uncharacterized protein LOC106662055 [Cimex lectularius]
MNPWMCVAIFFAASTAARSTKDLKLDPESETKLAKQLEEIEKELELVEKLENEIDGNSSREARGLLKKLSFMAGMKVGGIIESSGTLAASNSLRIFGKVMNTALSVSYGPIENLEVVPPIHDQSVVEENIKAKPISFYAVESSSPSSSPTRQGFIKNHNNLVNRVNTKFLKNGASLRSI